MAKQPEILLVMYGEENQANSSSAPVASNESIEAVLNQHPAITETKVYEVEIPEYGRKLVASVKVNENFEPPVDGDDLSVVPTQSNSRDPSTDVAIRTRFILQHVFQCARQELPENYIPAFFRVRGSGPCPPVEVLQSQGVDNWRLFTKAGYKDALFWRKEVFDSSCIAQDGEFTQFGFGEQKRLGIKDMFDKGQSCNPGPIEGYAPSPLSVRL